MNYDLLVYIYWASLALLIYPYIIYPVVLKFLSTAFPAIIGFNKNKELPTITLIISAFNEQDVISEKIANTLGIDYPNEKLEVLIVSDASDDNTDDIVCEWAKKDERIKLLRQENRYGKTSGINRAVRTAKNEIIVFSDANAMYAENALKELVIPFSNDLVGYVVGAALYNEESDNNATESEGLYWDLELKLKKLESDFYSVVGGDGAIYAIRRGLFWELKADDINDFVNPLQIIAHGYRGIFNPNAICYEDSADDFSKEFKRKRRIVNRSWRAITRYIRLLSPFKYKRYYFLLISHKVIRWFSLHILGILLIANIGLVLGTAHYIYTISFFGILTSLTLGFIGYILDRKQQNMPKVVYLPYYYLLVNTAAFLGILDQVRGIKHSVWTHVRNK